jgi:hypothetical protein
VLRSGDQKRATEYEENEPNLSIFEERDHGSLLQAFGGRSARPSTKRTGQSCRWCPTQPGLLPDLDRPSYFDI